VSLSEEIVGKEKEYDTAFYVYLSEEEEIQLREKGYLTAGKLDATGNFVNLMEPALFSHDEMGLISLVGRTAAERVREK